MVLRAYQNRKPSVLIPPKLGFRYGCTFLLYFYTFLYQALRNMTPFADKIHMQIG